MNISHTIMLDMQQIGTPPTIYAKQLDSLSRAVTVSLYNNGTAWSIPSDATILAVGYRKPDGTRGLYDTMPGGGAAVSANGNTAVVQLAPQMFTAAGTVLCELRLANSAGAQLSSFSWRIRVEESAADGSAAEDYYNLKTLNSLQEQIGNLENLQTKKKTSLVAAINEVLAGSGGGGGCACGTDVTEAWAESGLTVKNYLWSLPYGEYTVNENGIYHSLRRFSETNDGAVVYRWYVHTTGDGFLYAYLYCTPSGDTSGDTDTELLFWSSEEDLFHVFGKNVATTDALAKVLADAKEYVDKSVAPLEGTTDDLTPQQVYDAVKAGRPVVVTHAINAIAVNFTWFNVAMIGNESGIVSNAIGELDDGILCFNLAGSMSEAAWKFKIESLALDSSAAGYPDKTAEYSSGGYGDPGEWAGHADDTGDAYAVADGMYRLYETSDGSHWLVTVWTSGHPYVQRRMIRADGWEESSGLFVSKWWCYEAPGALLVADTLH